MRCFGRKWSNLGLVLGLGLFGILMLSNSAHGKDLNRRLGVGYSNQFSHQIPSVSARYYSQPKLGFSASLGVDTKEEQSKFGFMVKLYRIIFEEDNLNFYMGTGVGLISEEKLSSDNESGFELNGFAGAEFFLSGLESVGFSFEMGIGVTSVSSEVRFRTIGDSPFQAGVIFYF